jgi:hypothetical protein
MPNLLDEPLSFTLCLSGNNYYGLFFEGEGEALERMHNFCLSYGLSKTVHTYKENHHYVLAPLDRIKSCLINCFRGEIVKNKNEEIHYVTKELRDEVGDAVEITVEWDEGKLNQLAEDKYNLFIERASRECLFEKVHKKFTPDFYEVAPINELWA